MPTPIADRWLLWRNRGNRIDDLRRDLVARPNDRGLRAELRKLEASRARLKVPPGWSSFDAIEAKLIETGQFNPLDLPARAWGQQSIAKRTPDHAVQASS